MKKYILAMFVCLCISLPADEKYPLVTPGEKYKAPTLSSRDAWTIVLVPDTQNYVKNMRTQGILDIMLSWVAENVDRMKTQMVLFTGDMVDQNRSLQTRPWRNQNAIGQWEGISRAAARLDNVVPYVVCTGNHDHGNLMSEDRQTELSRYFTPARNNKWKNVLIDMGKDSQGDYTLENAAYEFTTPHKQKVLVITIGFAPTDAQIKWARDFFARKEYKNHFGILLVHSYLNENGHIPTERYPISQKDGNSGKAIYQKLVQKSSNIRMVVCGHAAGINDWKKSAAHFVSVNGAGKKVHEILFNPQMIHGNGGDGWIRFLEFSKDMKTVKIRTFSPLFASSPATRHLAWHTAPFNEFVITFE